MRKLFSIIVLLFFALIGIYSCKDDPPNVNTPFKLELSLLTENTSCIEAWLELKLNDSGEVSLYRDDSLICKINLSYSDTLFCDKGLLPNRSYTYKAVIDKYGATYTHETSVQTMDTTSQAFIWQAWEFGGEIGSSVIFDVAIIDENNIWAVGEIYIKDTSVTGYTIYNAIHWDGNEWELKRIPFTGSCSGVVYPAIRSIWIFSETDICFARAGSVVHYYGTSYYNDCGINSLLTGRINKIWAKDINDIYFVGDKGSLARYYDGKWIKIESGTEYNINDIWGGYNVKTGEWEVLAVAGNYLEGNASERAIIRINENKTEVINSDGIRYPLLALWFMPGKKYYPGGAGIYSKHNLNENLWLDITKGITEYHSFNIHGQEINDVVTGGSYGDLIHFNGIRWKNFRNEIGNYYYEYFASDIKQNIIAAAGTSGREAVVTIGFRN